MFDVVDFVELGFLALLIAFAVLVGFVSSFTTVRAKFGAHQESVRRARNAKHAKLRYAAVSKFTRDPKFQGGPFGSGDLLVGRDIMYGERSGVPVLVFEYQWMTTVDDQKQLFTRMVAAAWVGGSFPRVEAHREGAVSDLPGDILLESIAFNKMYRVTCPDRERALAFLHPRVLDFAVSAGDMAPGFWIENGWVFTSWPAGRGADADTAMLRGLGFAAGVAGLTSSLMAKDYGMGYGAGPVPSAAVKGTELFPGLSSAPSKPVREPMWQIVGLLMWDMARSVGRKVVDWAIIAR